MSFKIECVFDWFQVGIIPNANEQNPLMALNDSRRSVSLLEQDCVTVAPYDFMKLHRVCVETRHATRVAISVFHENGVSTTTVSCSWIT